MKRLRLKKAEPDDKRLLILRAAIEVFARRGYSNATVNEVAERAGIASGTVYLYFHNKVDLFIKSMREVIGNRLTEIKKIVRNEVTAIDKLNRFISQNIQLFTQSKDAVRFMVVEWRKSEDFINLNPGYNPFEEYLDYVEGLCREAVESRAIRKVNPRTLAFMIVGTMDFVLTQWVSDPDGFDLESMSAEMHGILRHGLVTQ
ncbi:MAG TPA: TetR/AcrR family transcriptional regulator [Candidatus Cloacimonadota bacterium]|nr:TetR/AcrR family transcriptional regulator [Candidatus Cloacimonadota bacterium]HPS39754.1 TetR/AcrR family transcriptional regulator [Candidatus Cloacimonadota bacterium]